MGRPTTKSELLRTAADNFDSMNLLISSLTEQELMCPFDFSGDEKKKEAHWKNCQNS